MEKGLIDVVRQGHLDTVLVRNVDKLAYRLAS